MFFCWDPTSVITRSISLLLLSGHPLVCRACDVLIQVSRYKLIPACLYIHVLCFLPRIQLKEEIAELWRRCIFHLLPVPSKVFSLGKVMLAIKIDCQIYFFLFFIPFFLKEDDRTNLGCFLIAVEA